VQHKKVNCRGICRFPVGFAYLLMTLLAIIRCSESKKLNGDPVRWASNPYYAYATYEDGSSRR